MDKLQALGREIRYVEYKLRRQQQEKKKKKQMQRDFVNGSNGGSNGGGYTDMSNNNSGALSSNNSVQAREFNFDQESDFAKSVANSVGGVTGVTAKKSEIEKARPSTEQEEQLQLELALAMSRDAAETVQSPTTTGAPATANLFDVSSTVATSPPAQTFNPWAGASSSVPTPAAVVPPPSSQPPAAAWDPFASAAPAPAPVSVPRPTAAVDPFSGGISAQTSTWGAQPAPPAPAAPAQAGWTAFDDSFSAPAQPQQAAPVTDTLFDLPTTAAPVTNNVLQPNTQPASDNLLTPSNQTNDLLGGDGAFGTTSAPQNDTSQTEAQKLRKTPTDFLGLGANLVNFDNLVSKPKTAATCNPFMSSMPGVKKTNPFQKQGPGVSMNQMASQQTSGFEGLSGGGMAPLMPTSSSAPQVVQSPSSSAAPVFSSQPQNLMFGVQPLSLQNQKNNPFNY